MTGLNKALAAIAHAERAKVPEPVWMSALCTLGTGFVCVSMFCAWGWLS